MRLSLLLAFWATLLTLVFASYVHPPFPLLNTIDAVPWLMQELGQGMPWHTLTNRRSDIRARVGRLRDI
jgi:hypothetical protein